MRLFFALVPDEDALRELARAAEALAAELGGRPVPEGKIHLTLAFLGEVADERMPVAHAAAEDVRGRPFTLALDRQGSFRRAGVAWAGASAPDPELTRVQAVLASGLETVGFALEPRPFAPHVTLVRKVEKPLRERTVAAIGWRVTDFALVRSNLKTGAYETLERYALG